jgi:hypothetical protein
VSNRGTPLEPKAEFQHTAVQIIEIYFRINRTTCIENCTHKKRKRKRKKTFTLSLFKAWVDAFIINFSSCWYLTLSIMSLLSMMMVLYLSNLYVANIGQVLLHVSGQVPLSG